MCLPLHTRRIECLASAGRDATVRLWDPKTPTPSRGHDGLVTAVAFSPDGKTL